MKNRGKKMTYQEHLKSKLKDPEFKKYYADEGWKLQIGYKIFELRTKHGLTQTQLAKKIGTTQSTIARLESADTDNYEIQTLERIAEVLGRKLVVEFKKAA